MEDHKDMVGSSNYSCCNPIFHFCILNKDFELALLWMQDGLVSIIGIIAWIVILPIILRHRLELCSNCNEQIKVWQAMKEVKEPKGRSEVKFYHHHCEEKKKNG
jgi:hypothetical protein